MSLALNLSLQILNESARFARIKSTIFRWEQQGLLDSFFENGHIDWWQKGNAYIHRKIFIDGLFGHLNASDHASVVKLYLLSEHDVKNLSVDAIPLIIKSKFKQLKTTGKEAEVYFLNNYQNIADFADTKIEEGKILVTNTIFSFK